VGTEKKKGGKMVPQKEASKRGCLGVRNTGGVVNAKQEIGKRNATPL